MLLSKVIFCPYIEMGVAKLANIFWPALESFVLPLSTTYLKNGRAARFAEERYFIEVRPLNPLEPVIRIFNEILCPSRIWVINVKHLI